jgi:hypothetical protein
MMEIARLVGWPVGLAIVGGAIVGYGLLMIDVPDGILLVLIGLGLSVQPLV